MPKKIDMRDKIIQASAHLFAEHGFHEVSMRDIAQKAGISGGNIYHYFPNKDDLVAQTLEHTFREGMRNFPLLAKDDLPPQKRLHVFVDWVVRLLHNDHTFSRLFIRSALDRSDQSKQNIIQKVFSAPFNAQNDMMRDLSATSGRSSVDSVLLASLVVGQYVVWPSPSHSLEHPELNIDLDVRIQQIMDFLNILLA